MLWFGGLKLLDKFYYEPGYSYSPSYEDALRTNIIVNEYQLSTNTKYLSSDRPIWLEKSKKISPYNLLIPFSNYFIDRKEIEKLIVCNCPKTGPSTSFLDFSNDLFVIRLDSVSDTLQCYIKNKIDGSWRNSIMSDSMLLVVK